MQIGGTTKPFPVGLYGTEMFSTLIVMFGIFLGLEACGNLFSRTLQNLAWHTDCSPCSSSWIVLLPSSSLACSTISAYRKSSVFSLGNATHSVSSKNVFQCMMAQNESSELVFKFTLRLKTRFSVSLSTEDVTSIPKSFFAASINFCRSALVTGIVESCFTTKHTLNF